MPHNAIGRVFSKSCNFIIFIEMIAEQEHIKIIQQKDVQEEVLLPSFLYLFEQHRGMLYAIALRLLGYGEDAKDAVQETFIKAYTHLHTLKDKAALSGWLRSIIYNHCMLELRNRKKASKALETYAKGAELTEAAHDLDKTSASIKTTLAGLPEVLQLTAMLRFFSKNSSYNQIALILGIPIGTVRSRLAESRAKLFSFLSRENCYEKTGKAKEMEDFYQFHMADMYDNPIVKNAFLNHFHKQVLISVTSGKVIVGSGYIKKLIEFDLEYGAVTTLDEVNSSGNVSVLEIVNINPDDNPTLCPVAATFIAVHPHNKVEKIFLHNAQLPQDR